MLKRFCLLLLAMMWLVSCGPQEAPAPAVDEPDSAIDFVETEIEEADPTDVASAPTLAPEATDIPATDVPEPTNEPATAIPEPTEESADEMDEAEEMEGEEMEEEEMAEEGKPIEGATFPAEDVPTAYVWRTTDHYKGATNPDVLIVEYGDFQ